MELSKVWEGMELFSVKDAPWDIISTKKIILETRSAIFHEGDALKLQNADKICGAEIEKILSGDENILMDSYFRDNLGVKLGDTVHIEKIEPKNAENVRFLVPYAVPLKEEEEDKEIRDLLLGTLICDGNTNPIVVENTRWFIEVDKTIPTGIVEITELTSIEIAKTTKLGAKKVIKLENGELKDITVETPDVSWEDIGGLDAVKRILKEDVIYGITKSAIYKKMGIRPQRGTLLYGPPGTGKTSIAKAVANEAGATFIRVSSPEILSKWLGDSEKKIREIFSQARKNAPTVIFFDEIEGIIGERGNVLVLDTIVNQMLTEMDKVVAGEEDIFVIAATNKIGLVDKAMTRAGRFNIVEVPPPEGVNAREEIFRIHLRDTPLEDVDIHQLALMTEGYSGADIEFICAAAVKEALREVDFESEVKVKMIHFRKVIKGEDHDTFPMHG